MNENLNLVEILKDVPKGTRLWSPICGDCELREVGESYNDYPIECITKTDAGSTTFATFTANGEFCAKFAHKECVLFPSKGNRDWSTFKAPNTHKHFEPFQKVLRAIGHEFGYEVWLADFYSHYDDSTREHYLASGYVVDDDEIVPFEGNEDKLGKLVR